MGESKQLLLIRGKPLLQHTLEITLTAGTGEVVVVLGANERAHRSLVESTNAQIVFNPHWESGIGSSIKAGLNYINKHLANSSAIIISVCDQPYLTSTHFKTLVNTYLTSHKKIVASSYKNILGVPALFDQALFEVLAKIDDSDGAKSVIKKHADDVVGVPFPLGDIDLDTREDYDTFNQ